MVSMAHVAAKGKSYSNLPNGSAFWKEISAVTGTHIYPSGLELFRQDSTASDVYFIETGLIKLMRSEDNGRQLILGLRFPGSLLGSAAAIHDCFHPFAAVTVTDCKLMRISARRFLNLLAEDSRLALCLNEMLSGELVDQASRISQIACLPARRRLEQLLWQLITEQGINDIKVDYRFQLPLRQWETAQLLAITPTYLSRLFGELEREEIISRTKGWIVIRKPEDLWHSLSV